MHYKLPIEFIDIDIKAVILTMLILSPSILMLIINILLNFRTEIQSQNIMRRNPKGKVKNLDKEISNLSSKNKNQYESIVDLKIELSSLNVSIEKLLNKELTNTEREILGEERIKIKQIEKEVKDLEYINREIEQDLAYRNTDLNEVKEKLFKLRIQMVKRLSSLSILSCILIILMICLFKANLYMVIYLIIGQLGLLWLTEILYRKKKVFLVIISIVIYLVIFAFGSGVNYGYLQEKHIIFEEKENHYIALTLYKDQFLYAQYDPETNQAEASFSFKKVEDVKKLSKRKIGKIEVINKPFFEK